MCAYGVSYLASGMAIALVVVIGASRCVRLRFRLPLLFVAALALWTAMFIAADMGYRAWQSIPDPPEEAYSDTGPIFFLVAGWLPGAAIAYLLLLICWWILPLRPIPPHKSQSTTRSQDKSEQSVAQRRDKPRA